MFKQYDKYKIENGVLVRTTTAYGNQIVLPKVCHHLVYEELHSKMAHLGSDRVLELAKQRFYWPGMAKDIEVLVRHKCRCVKDKTPNRPERAALVNIESQRPFQIVSVDYLKLDQCKGGYEYVLIIVDHFTRFVQAFATKNKSGRSAAEKIFNELVLKFGFPEKLHHDQGREFNNNMFKRFHQLSGIKSSQTTPYHPMGDGQVERMNRTFINMLKTLPENYKSNWKAELPKLSFAYNSTICKSTGHAPFFLMFGRNSRLPIDLMFGLENLRINESHETYVNKWKESLQNAIHIAQKAALN